MSGNYGGDGYPVDPATLTTAQEPRSLSAPIPQPSVAQTVGVGVANVPVSLIGGDGIRIKSEGLSGYSINLAIDRLEPANAPMTSQWVAVWDSETGTDDHRRIQVNLIPVDAPHDGIVYGRLNGDWADIATTVAVNWSAIVDKPATFPPTLPIPQTGVTDLTDDLSDLADAVAALNLNKADVTYVDGQNAAQNTVINSKVSKAGDTMTGALTLPVTPTALGHATSKQYVDAGDAANAAATAGLDARVTAAEGNIATLTTDVATAQADATTAIADAAAAQAAADAAQADADAAGTLAASKVSKAGDTMTGALVLPGDPTSPLQAATKAYVDANAGGGGIVDAPSDGTLYGRKDAAWAAVPAPDVTKSYVDAADALLLPKAGGTMSGAIVLPGNPTLPLQAAPKQYVDAAVAAGVARVAPNMVPNPSFQISQEFGSVEQTVAGSYAADCWSTHFTGASGTVGAQRSTSQGVDCYAVRAISALAMGAGDFVLSIGSIEGYDTAPLLWGFAAAKRAIIRFRARLSGPAGSPVNISVNLRNTGLTRSFCKLVSIASGDVWNDYTVIVPADTVGLWNTTNNVGIALGFVTACGSTLTAAADGVWANGNFLAAPGQDNMHAAASRSIRFTDVGVYVDQDGSGVAPVFQRPLFSDELRRAKRYWEARGSIVLAPAGYLPQGFWETEKRAAPAITIAPFSGSGATFIATGLTGFYQNSPHSAYSQGNLYGNARI